MSTKTALPHRSILSRGRLALGLTALWLLSGVYIVRPEQQAVVQLFGRVAQSPVTSGLHWRAPWPVGRLSKVRVTQARRVSVGFNLAQEAAGSRPGPRQGEFLSGDQNIVDVQLVVQYCVDDAVAYLLATQSVDDVVAAAVEKALSRSIQNQTIDHILTVGRTQLQDTVRTRAAQTLTGYGAGTRIVSVSIKAAAPPTQVSDAFRAVASAREDRDRIIDEAHGYLNEVVEKARGEADREGKQASAYRERVVAQAQGRAEAFRKLRAEHAKAPDVTRTRLYLETIEQVLPRAKVIVSDGDDPDRPLDLAILRPEAGRPEGGDKQP